jgi:RND family efflux transporter MFP subunit
LTAPISGLVSAVNVIPGQPVSADNTLAEIIDLTKVYALARVPEHLAGRLRRGQSAHITVAAASGETYLAKLEHLGVIADPESGTLEAAFHVDNPRLALRPGMRAEFSIVVATHPDVTSVPRGAIQGTPAQRFVYVKDFELPHAFVKTPVVTGRSNDRFVEIISGLLPSDEVVTQGAYSLAFAGAGTLSLKEALDAAHGHEHAADGSELKAGAAAQSKSVHPQDEHAHDHAFLWKILTGVFFVAFVVTLLARKPGAPA